MSNFKVEETKHVYGAKIKVIGVGGGGGNMINHMAREGVGGVDLIAANTDAQALDISRATVKIQLGERKNRGLGSGGKPDIARESAEESYEEIKSALEHADIVFIAAGLGGGTGTGASPIVARAAKEIGALTVSITTKPFEFEGKKRMQLAENGLNELKKESDSIVVIPNDKLLNIIDTAEGFEDSFKIVDSILCRAVSGMSGVILSRGIINVDFADVQTIMSHRGKALLGVGEGTGADAANEAVKNAIQSPLLDDISINGALGVLVHFYAHPKNCPLRKIQEAMNIIHSAASSEADIIFGITADDSLENGYVRVTIVATGFDSKLIDVPEINRSETRERTIFINKRVSGGDNIQEDFLDIPTIMRNPID